MSKKMQHLFYDVSSMLFIIIFFVLCLFELSPENEGDALVMNRYALFLILAWLVILFKFDALLKIKVIDGALAYIILVYLLVWMFDSGRGEPAIFSALGFLLLTWLVLMLRVAREHGRISKEFEGSNLELMRNKIPELGIFYYPSYWNLFTSFLFFVYLPTTSLGELTIKDIGNGTGTGTGTVIQPLGVIFWILYTIRIMKTTYRWKLSQRPSVVKNSGSLMPEHLEIK